MCNKNKGLDTDLPLRTLHEGRPKGPPRLMAKMVIRTKNFQKLYGCPICVRLSTSVEYSWKQKVVPGLHRKFTVVGDPVQ